MTFIVSEFLLSAFFHSVGALAFLLGVVAVAALEVCRVLLLLLWEFATWVFFLFITEERSGVWSPVCSYKFLGWTLRKWSCPTCWGLPGDCVSYYSAIGIGLLVTTLVALRTKQRLVAWLYTRHVETENMGRVPGGPNTDVAINVCRETPLPEHKDGMGQHPSCAGARARSKAWVNTLCQKLNLQRYNLSMSRAESRMGVPGNKEVYELKDTQSNLVVSTTPDVNDVRNVGVVVVDVFNHLSAKQLFEIGGHVWLGHTFYPRTVAGKQQDSGFGPETTDKWFHWTYASDDRTSERPWALRELFTAWGWDSPRGPLEWVGASLAALVGFRPQVPRLYAYTCYHRRVSDSHVAFVAFPHARMRPFVVLALRLLGQTNASLFRSWWESTDLGRLQSTMKSFTKGERTIVGYSLSSQSTDGAVTTWAMAGSDVCHTIDRAAVEAIQMLSATTSQGATLHNAQNVLPRVGGRLVDAKDAVATLVYSQCGPMQQPVEPGPLINSYRSSATQDIKPMHVVTLCLCPASETAFAPEVSNTEELFTQMYRSTLPAEEAVLYTCATIADTAKNMSYVREFIALVVEDVLKTHGKLAAPWDEATVREALNSPSQTTLFEKGALSDQQDDSCVNESFTKNERYAGPKMARKIEPMDCKHKLDIARFAKGLLEVLTKLHWWGPGKKPREIQEKLSLMLIDLYNINCGDGKVHDGHMEQLYSYIFVEITCALFEECYRAEWRALCARPQFRRVFSVLATIIAAFDLGSGDPRTTVCNTFSTGVGDYVSQRLDGRSPREAYDAMGLSYGDDIANSASKHSTVEAFRWLGYNHEYESFERNAPGVNFLSRFRGPLAWMGSDDSMANPRRAIISLCYSGHLPKGWTKEQLIVAKALGYLETDAYTPLVGAFCATIVAMAIIEGQDLPARERREEVSWNAQFEGNNWSSMGVGNTSASAVLERTRRFLREGAKSQAVDSLVIVASEIEIAGWKWDIANSSIPNYEKGGVMAWLWAPKHVISTIYRPKYSLSQLVQLEVPAPKQVCHPPILSKVVNEVAYEGTQDENVAKAKLEATSATNRLRRKLNTGDLESILSKAPHGDWDDANVDAYCNAYFSCHPEPRELYVAALKYVRATAEGETGDAKALWLERAKVLQRNYNRFKKENPATTKTQKTSQ